MQHRGSAQSTGHRWVRWARRLILGIVCVGIQPLVIWATVLLQGPWILAAVLSAGSCLGIGFLEGYLATSRQGTVSAGTAAGEMVGVMGVVTIGVLIVVVVVVVQSRACLQIT